MSYSYFLQSMDMTKTCPKCARPATGRFCSHCGTAVAAERSCRSCGEQIPAGGKFCIGCGAEAAGIPAADAGNARAVGTKSQTRVLPWALAGGVLVAILAVLFYPGRQTADEALVSASGPPITGTATGTSGVDLASMSPREAADRLFNRVMQAVSVGDSAQAHQFLPMALAAYDRVETLDRDGRYHVAVLQLVNDNPTAAREQAELLLDEVPQHLFGLATAAQAQMSLGNSEEALELYSRFLEHYDSEIASGLPEYSEHAAVLPSIRAEAVAATAN